MDSMTRALGTRWRPFRVGWRTRCAPVVGLLIGAGVIPNCSSTPTASPVSVATPDRNSDGRVAVDKAKITGSLAGGTLKVVVPVRAVDPRGASGSLHIRLLDVQGQKVVADAVVPYALGPSGLANLQADLPSPSGVASQADLALYNVRVDDNKPSSLRVTRSLLLVIPPYDVRLEGPKAVTQGKGVSYRVRAEDALTRAPAAGAAVTLDVLAKDGSNVVTLTGDTSATGEAFFPVMLGQAGDFQIRAGASQNGITPNVADAVTVATLGPKILLTSDKPIYQPGQTIHLRSLALTTPDDKPLAAAPVLLEVEDGKGNKVFKQSVTTDAFGIAATTFTLGTLVNTGTFTLRATSAAAKTEKTVSVSIYALPKFDVAVATDKPWYRPGDAIVGTVDARYFFGKTLGGGNVVLQASSLDVGQTPFQNVMGVLDAAGHFQFSLTVPSRLAGTPLGQGNASVSLHIAVTDTAGQTVEKDTLLLVSPDGVNVALIPDSTQLVAGLDNELDLFVTDPLGAPLAGAAAVVLAPDSQSFPATTDAFGQAAVVWHAPGDVSASATFQVQVTPTVGASVLTKSFAFTSQAGAEHLIVRTDAALYKLGDTVKVDVATSDVTHNVYVDWINAGQAVSMRTLTAAGGHASFAMTVDASLVGSNRIEAYVVDAAGNIVRGGRTVFVRTDSALSVSMAQDKPIYAPGDPAKLTFAVTDSQGQPAVAALGVEIVDQSVFSLVDAHPGLLRSFFELESIYATPTYEIAAPPVDYSTLLFSNDTQPDAAQAHQTLTKASFAALGEGSISAIAHGSWSDVLTNEKTLLAPAYTAESSALSGALHALGAAILAELQADGCPTNSYYCSALGKPIGDLFNERLAARFSAWDDWGNPLAMTSGGWFSAQLTSRGPDEVAGSADDSSMQVDLSDLAAGASLGGVGGFGGARGGADAGAGGPVIAPGAAQGAAGGSSGGGSSSSGGAATTAVDDTSGVPRVRKDFPETLYVNPSIITGPDGIASVDVPLADNITEWRVSTMANSSDGKLGGGESGFKVFQDFFVDVNFPATLTRGDQVSFPVAIYNYLTTAQTVALTLAPDTWYTPTGATTLTITMQPGQVSGVSFPVRVDAVGLHSLTVQALGASKSDAVARSVQVLPDGKPFAEAFSGVISDGATADHVFQYPAGDVPGSQQLYVEVYPAFLSQVVNGMESLLRAPYGCFEQTTSTTWPNVLVLSYLTRTNKLTPEIQLKAESLISTGYQRLLTFEHPGGGFSWFGTQDPAPYLSVTAFGLMEFADMAKVANVDDAMIARTRAWLLAQQQADGSWNGDRTEFFSFNTSTVRNTAFVLWALGSDAYTGPEIGKGVAYVRAHASDGGTDAYTLALIANALEISAPGDPANDAVFAALDGLKQVAGDQVHWDTGGTQTCFYQGGADSSVSATALATHALLLRGGYPSSVDGAIKFLTAQKDTNGNFGSTQATVWTLRALLLAASQSTDGAVGALNVLVDGALSRTLTLTADQSDVMTTVDLSGQAASGNHDLSVSFAGTGKVSFNMVGKYNLPWSLVPPPAAGPLTITVSYDKTSLYVNDTVQETVNVHNNDPASSQNMVLATVGIPPGFGVSTGDLDALLKAKMSLSKYEVTGKQVVLYISKIPPSADATIHYGLYATMPVHASDGAAEAHPYYQPSQSTHAPAQTLDVLAR
jgi:alpha-2-macroglobulin-like protein